MSDRIYRAEDDEDDQVHLPHITMWDHRLSVRARGLLAMLLCLRPGMSVSTAELAVEMRAVGGRATEGRDALRVARRELEQVGYLGPPGTGTSAAGGSLTPAPTAGPARPPMRGCRSHRRRKTRRRVFSLR